MFPFQRKKQLPDEDSCFLWLKDLNDTSPGFRPACVRGNFRMTGLFDPRQFSNDQACLRPWHFLYFLPEPQGQGSLGMIFLAFLL